MLLALFGGFNGVFCIFVRTKSRRRPRTWSALNEQLGLLMESSNNTEALQTALANWRNGLDILAATSLTVQ